MPDQPRKSSSSKKAKNPSASDPILNLGRKLVAALKVDDDDLLSHWMAHHIAELITQCDTADPATKMVAKERCAAAILDLWSHRASMTGNSKPFQELAPIIETLRALDPDAEHVFYRRTIPNAEGATSEETTRWLNFARNCDAIARMLIGIGIDKASEHADGDALEWAATASKAGFDFELDIQLVDFLESRLGDAGKSRERRIQELKGRVEKLESFSTMASALRTDLLGQLKALESADQAQSGPSKSKRRSKVPSKPTS